MTNFLRVVSFNTAKGDGAYRRRLAGMVEPLRALNADLILLQEALRTTDDRLDTARHLARALAMEQTALTVRQKDRFVDGEWRLSWSSPAVLSRWPIAEAHTLALPWEPADGERAALAARVVTPIGEVRLVNAHLTHLPTPAVRRSQLATILGARWLAEPADLRVLGGDLNATADDPELSALWDGSAGWDAIDAVATGGASGGTLVEMATGQARSVRRVDHLVVLRTARDPLVTVLRARLVLGDRPGGLALSDHLGVLADLALPAQGDPGALV
jgi:endonuclease/exonuclease/phosphatase family metal-dependent hydrolase